MRLRDLVLQLHPDESLPVSRRLRQALVDAIQQGRLLPGQAIPGSRVIADRVGLNRNTVVAVLEELEAEGWLESFPNRGTFVPERLPETGTAPVELPERESIPKREAGFILPSHLQPLSTANAHLLDLSDGTADPTLAPSEALAKAYQRALRRHGDTLLTPGDPLGNPLLRECLAAWFSERRGMPITPREILITRGGSAGLHLFAQGLLRNGDRMAVENPGRREVWDAIRRSGQVELIPIPVDQQGMDVARLAEHLAHRSIQAVYVTPQSQFPSGVALCAERRRHLLELAEQHRFAILEEDSDAEYPFGEGPGLPLASQDPNRHVVYTASFSRWLAPGIHVGCLVGASDLVERLARLQRNQDGQGDRAMEWAVADLMRDGDLARHLRKARKIYEGRMRFLVDGLRQALGGRIAVEAPMAGLAVWLRFLDGQQPEAWIESCRREGLRLHPPTHYYLDAPHPCTRMGFAQAPETALTAALATLARVSPPAGHGVPTP